MTAHLHPLLTRLGERAPWALSLHDAPCCRRARAWYLQRARAAPSTDALVSWVHERWTWGPHPWPLHWCDVPRAPHLDCEAASHVVVEALRDRGVHAEVLQVIERFDASAVTHWRAAWVGAGVPCDWIAGDLVYHAAVAAFEGGAWRGWDPSDGCVLDDKPVRGYDSVVAVRVAGEARGSWALGEALQEVLRGLAAPG